MNLSELKRRERELRHRLGDERYEQMYIRQQRAEAVSKPATPAYKRPEISLRAVNNKVENSFYTNRPDSGIIPNKPEITDLRKGIEDLNKKIESLNKQQYNTMFSGDDKKTAAYDSVISNAEKQRDALKTQMARAMGVGSESADGDTPFAYGYSIEDFWYKQEKARANDSGPEQPPVNESQKIKEPYDYLFTGEAGGGLGGGKGGSWGDEPKEGRKEYNNGNNESAVKSYSSSDEAAIAFLVENQGKSQNENKEYGTVIYEKDGRFYLGKTHVGSDSGVPAIFFEAVNPAGIVTNAIGNGCTVVGTIHTHPKEYDAFGTDSRNNSFSGMDALLPGIRYLGAPNGGLYKSVRQDEPNEIIYDKLPVVNGSQMALEIYDNVEFGPELEKRIADFSKPIIEILLGKLK